MPVVFGEMKMSFCVQVLKKGQLGLSEKAIDEIVNSGNRRFCSLTISAILTLSLPRVLSSKLRPDKILSYIFQTCQKQTVPHESTAQ